MDCRGMHFEDTTSYMRVGETPFLTGLQRAHLHTVGLIRVILATDLANLPWRQRPILRVIPTAVACGEPHLVERTKSSQFRGKSGNNAKNHNDFIL